MRAGRAGVASIALSPPRAVDAAMASLYGLSLWPLSMASLYGLSLRPLSTASLYGLSLRPLSTASLYGLSLRPLSTATLYGLSRPHSPIPSLILAMHLLLY
jgi:hypothetical protein